LLDGSQEARASVVVAHEWNGQTPLQIAAYLNQRAVMDALIAAGAREDEWTQQQAESGQRVARHTEQKVEAMRSVEHLSVFVRNGEEATLGWVAKAAELWQHQGVVIFPALLNRSVVSTLGREARAALLDGTADLSAQIRQGSGHASGLARTLKPMPVGQSRDALATLASLLSPFLEAALGGLRQLLLDFGVYRTAAGAEAQEWHTDSPFKDARIAHVQISLVDTGLEQGAIEVQPTTHLPQSSEDELSDPSSTRGESFMGLPVAPVSEGTVVFYRLDLRHRGGLHTRPEQRAHSVGKPPDSRSNVPKGDRLIVTLKLMAEHAFVPDGIPLKVLPEDAGRWWLVDGAVEDRSSATRREHACP